jgi:hypothetical protein
VRRRKTINRYSPDGADPSRILAQSGSLGKLEPSSLPKDRPRVWCRSIPRSKMAIFLSFRRTSPMSLARTHDNRTHYAGAGSGGGLSSAIICRMSANRFRGMATSAIWKATKLVRHPVDAGLNEYRAANATSSMMQAYACPPCAPAGGFRRPPTVRPFLSLPRASQRHPRDLARPAFSQSSPAPSAGAPR